MDSSARLVDSRPVYGANASSSQRVRSPSVWLVVGLVALIAYVGFLYLAYPTPWGDKPSFASPRHNVDYELTLQWLTNDAPVYELESYEVLPERIARALTPRDASILDNEVVPREFPAAIAFQAMLASIDPNLMALTAPLLAGLAVLGVWLVMWQLTHRAAPAVGAAVVFGAASPLLAASLRPLATDAGGVAAAMFGIWAILKADDPDRKRSRSVALLWGVLAGLFLGSMIAFRYTNALLAVLIAIVVIVKYRKSPFVIAGAFLGGSLAIGLMLSYHVFVYGGFLANGYSVGQDLVYSTVNPTRSWPFGFNAGVFRAHLVTYLLRPEALALAGLAVLGMWLALRRPIAAKARMLIVPTIVFSVAIALYQGGRNTFGSTFFAVNASFTRYLLPVAALFSVFVGVAFWLSPRWWRIPLSFVLALGIGLNVYTFGTTPGGYDTGKSAVRQVAARSELLAAINPEGFVISRAADKILWPDRQTLTASYLVQNEEPIDLGLERFYSVVPPTDELALIASELCSLNQLTYFLNDGAWIDGGFAELASQLGRYGHSLQTVLANQNLVVVAC